MITTLCTFAKKRSRKTKWTAQMDLLVTRVCGRDGTPSQSTVTAKGLQWNRSLEPKTTRKVTRNNKTFDIIWLIYCDLWWIAGQSYQPNTWFAHWREKIVTIFESSISSRNKLNLKLFKKFVCWVVKFQFLKRRFCHRLLLHLRQSSMKLELIRILLQISFFRRILLRRKVQDNEIDDNSSFLSDFLEV